MEIGEPKRVITIEPLEEPAPSKAPPPEKPSLPPEREREPIEAPPARVARGRDSPLPAFGRSG
jgi:hypothetical protein